MRYLSSDEPFSAVHIFRNTNANWQGWPRSGRSCVRVWTIFQEDSTTLPNDSSFTSWPDNLTLLLLQHLNLSLRHLISDFAIFLVLESVCVVTCRSHSVFNILFIHMAFMNRVSSFSVCEFISLCCMLSVHWKLRFVLVRQQAPLGLVPLKWHRWCWCDIFVFIVT